MKTYGAIIVFSLLLMSVISFGADTVNCNPDLAKQSLSPQSEKLAGLNLLIKKSDDPKAFYQSTLNYNGIIIKGSAHTPPEAMLKAAETIDKMLDHAPEIKKRLIAKHADIAIFANPKENYCDIPEMKNFSYKTFDQRDSCGLCGSGGVPGREVTIMCANNLLKVDKKNETDDLSHDTYFGKEDIFAHEFAHTIHVLGMDPKMQNDVTSLYTEAKKRGLFSKTKSGKDSYIMENEQEFFACLTAVWFNGYDPNNDNAGAPELVSRDSIKTLYPEAYAFLKSIYSE